MSSLLFILIRNVNCLWCLINTFLLIFLFLLFFVIIFFIQQRRSTSTRANWTNWWRRFHIFIIVCLHFCHVYVIVIFYFLINQISHALLLCKCSLLLYWLDLQIKLLFVMRINVCELICSKNNMKHEDRWVQYN